MIVLRAVRVEDSGAETELGEVRLTEVGAVFAHSATPEGHGVIADLRERLRAQCLCGPTHRHIVNRDCPHHGSKAPFCDWCRGKRSHDRYCPTLDVQP